MPAYVEQIEDDKGDIVDILYYCSWHSGDILPWPGYPWPDYDCHCETCGDLVHKGDESDGTDN